MKFLHSKLIKQSRGLKVAFVILIAAVYVFNISAPVAADVTQDRLKAYLDGGVATWYDEGFCAEGGESSAEISSGPAAAQMAKAGLDKDWINLIIKYSKQYKTDPMAMTALFFWENRGFPKYGKIVNGSPSNGSGPWQFTSGSWNATKYGSYDPNVYDPVKSTEAAAELVKSYGGVAGSPMGHIAQNFARGAHNTASMATVAKNYNAGPGTYRQPGQAKWNEQGRQWLYGSGQNWAGQMAEKPRIIDDYIVGMTYVYYQIATGQKITYESTNKFVQDGLKKQDSIKNFVFLDTGAGNTADDKVNTTTPPTGDAPVVVIDPGHSEKDRDEIDPQSGLRDRDYPNIPEIDDMWDVAKLIEADLSKSGYKVLLTKTKARETVSLRARSDIAVKNKADIAVSLHNMAGPEGRQFGEWAEIYYQFKGAYRESVKTGKRLTFENEKVANLSLEYSNTMKETRKAFEKITPEIKKNDYTRKDKNGNYILDPGNLGLVQLFSATVPWVYHEAGGNSAGRTGLNDADKKKYADGVINGIKKSLKPGTVVDSGEGCSGGEVGPGSGDAAGVADMARKLAWDFPYGEDRTYDSKNNRSSGATPKPEYASAAKKYLGFSGGTIVDCGVFVSTVMHASGADPNFPKIGTFNMEPYVKKHNEKYQVFDGANKITKVGDLKPGDILIINQGSGAGSSGHIMIFTGKEKDKKYDAASASLGARSGNMGPAYLSDFRGDYMVARLK